MSKPLSSLDINTPQLMGVLNVTPDSFSDGGNYYHAGKLSVDKCRNRVEEMLAEGATIIDVGGESTRPGAPPVSVQQEIDRVMPVIEAITDMDCVISLDTSSPELIAEATQKDIGLINDVRALQRSGALEAAVAAGLPVCLMHMQGQPGTMQNSPRYDDVLQEVSSFLVSRVEACLEAGMDKSQLLIDPGFGFGKTLSHNKTLLANLETFKMLELPIVVGMSRKSMINHILGERAVEQRMAASIALAVMAVERGAWIIRAHDIRETADAINVAAAILQK